MNNYVWVWMTFDLAVYPVKSLPCSLLCLHRAGLLLNVGYSLLCFIPLILFPDAIIDLFMGHTELMEGKLDRFGEVEALYGMMKTGLLLTAVYILLENLKWQFSGVLSAAGDTFFLMVSGLVILWTCMVMPTYVWITLNGGSTVDGMVIWVLFGSIAALVNAYRYWSGQWDKAQLITPLETA